MLVGAESAVNGHVKRRSVFLVAGVVGAFVGFDAVIAFEPAAEIDLRAAHRAERAVPWGRGFAADRAEPGRENRRIVHDLPI
jgi:hypothetical protein